MIQEATANPTGDVRGASAPPPADALGALSRLPREADDERRLMQDGFRLIAQGFQAAYAAVYWPDPNRPLTDYWHHGADAPDFWKPPANEALDRVLSTARPSARLFGAADAQVRVAILSVPLLDPDQPGVGGLVLIVPCVDREDAQAQLGRLRGVVDTLPLLRAALRSRLEGETSDPTQAGGTALEHVATPLLDALGSASGAKTVRQLAFTITNNLRTKVGCELVALGQVRRERVSIVSISGFADLSPRSPGVATIASAMEEALDAGTTLVSQAGGFGDEAGDRHRLHRAWRRQANGDAVASIPLRLDDQIVAVLSLRQTSGQGFDEEQLTRIEQAVTPYAAALLMVERATCGFGQHLARAVRESTKAVLLPRSVVRAALTAVLIAFGFWFAFGSLPYRVSATCTVSPSVFRQVTTPFDGKIAAAHFKAGDVVAAGEVLLELDTTELRREHDRLASQHAVQRIELDRALADGDSGRVRLAGAELRAIGIERDAVAAQLRSARVLAPADGVVVEGDLESLVGQPVSRGTPLYRLADTTGLRLEVAVPDHASAAVAAGLSGRFALDARPDQSHDLRVDRLLPSAQVREGRNVFIAESDVSDAPGWVRPGMQGVAKIEAGHRPVWWITLHRAIDWLRLKFWV